MAATTLYGDPKKKLYGETTINSATSGSGGAGVSGSSVAPVAAPPKPSAPDPFASIGGGVQLSSGEWVPKGHPLAASAAATPAAPAAPTAPKPIAPAPVAPAPAPVAAVPAPKPTPAPIATAAAPAPAAASPAPASTAPNPADPFASIGGGVKLASGEWVPKDHPLAKAQAPAPATAAPAGTTRGPGSTGAAPVSDPADPFASIGGGVKLPTGEWVPKDHPLAKQVVPTAPGGIITPPTTTTPTPAPTPAAAPLPAAPAAPTTPATPAPTTPAAPGAPSAASPAQVGGAFRDALMKMLSDNQQAPSINDPVLKGQADAYSLAQTRAADRARSAMAERRAQDGSTGTSSGAFDQDILGLLQQQGENEAGFNAGLVGTELQNRRNQLLQAATLAGNQMNAQDAQALQRELAQLDAQIKRESLTQQGSQFDKSLAQQTNQFGQTLAEQQRQSGIDAELKRLGITTQADLGSRDVALRDKLGSGQLNLGLLSALLQNRQADNSLSANVGMFNSSQNTNALLQALGML